MKVIFLDVDGVLNYNGFDRGATEMQNYGFAPELVSNLRRLLNETGAFIVISSSWRLYDDINEDIIGGKPWVKILENHIGLGNIIIDKIGYYHEYNLYWRIKNLNDDTIKHHGQYRGWDIKDWLVNHQDVSKFVILDDYVSESDISKVFLNQYVRCKCGFKDEEFEKALEILK